jgi:hypothetical protein
MVPIASHMGTNPTFCGISILGIAIAGDVVGTEVGFEVWIVPEGLTSVELPGTNADTGVKKIEIAHSKIRI